MSLHIIQPEAIS